ncbi:hypothetical protein KY366_01595 [Candidatus Woesearchaeota archaeon]|nr:hypothetical protein [Candidatus Woesearchaeota archaeon]
MDKSLRKKYTPEEDAGLEKDHWNNSIEELIEKYGRERGGIVQRLYKLSKGKKGGNWNHKQISVWLCQQQRIARGQDPDDYDPNFFYDDAIIDKLRQTINEFKKNDLPDLRRLEKIIGKTGSGMIQKLQKLYEDNPDEWDKKIIDSLYSQYMGEYRDSRKKRGRLRSIKKKKSKYGMIHERFLQREKEYNGIDIRILRIVHLTHNWLELARIFRYKRVEVHIKLRELFEIEGGGTWELGRILELENQADDYPIIRIKKAFGYSDSMMGIQVPLGYYAPASSRKNIRRPEIDSLVREGLNSKQIMEELKIPYMVLYTYLHSRGLFPLYKAIQRKRKMQNGKI